MSSPTQLSQPFHDSRMDDEPAPSPSYEDLDFA